MSEGHKMFYWSTASVSVNLRSPEDLRPHFIPNEIKNNTTFPVVHDLLEKDKKKSFRIKKEVNFYLIKYFRA